MPGMKLFRGSRGSALLLAVLVIALVTTFGALVLGVTEMASHSAEAQAVEEQVYFTKKSVADAMVTHLSSLSEEEIAALPESEIGSVTGLQEGMGTSTVSVTRSELNRVDDGHGNLSYTEEIKVTAMDETREADTKPYIATLTRQVTVTTTGTGGGISSVITLLNEALSLSSQPVSGGGLFSGTSGTSVSWADVGGDIYSLGSVTLSGNTVHGSIYANGNVTLGSGVTVKGEIHSGGTVRINGEGVVEGDIFASGNALLYGWDWEARNIYAGGYIQATADITAENISAGSYISLSGSGFSISENASANGYVTVSKEGTFGGNVYAGGYVYISNGSCPVYGDIYAGGSTTKKVGKVYYTVYTKSTLGNAGDGGVVHAPENSQVYCKYGSNGTVEESYYPTYVYEDSGYDYDAAVNSSPAWPLPDTWDQTITASGSTINSVTLDNTQADPLYAYVNKTLTITTLNVRGTGPVYLFLKAGEKLTLKTIDNKNTGGLFIIGLFISGQSRPTLAFANWLDSLEAYIYLPEGEVTVSSGIGSFTGRIVARTQTNFSKIWGITMGTSPALAGTPFETIVSIPSLGGGGGSSTTTEVTDWEVEYSGGS